MKLLLAFSLLLSGCGTIWFKITDDLIEGEISTAEKIAEDLSGVQSAR